MSFVEGDIADRAAWRAVFAEHGPTAVVNFAAETHVDRSIDGPRRSSTPTSSARSCCSRRRSRYVADSTGRGAERFRFLHVSTDEVYGSLGADGLFSEDTPYAPNSPYAASKAAADHLVRAYFHTYGLPAIITNCSNNYGPYQFPEKLIPLMILNALDGRPLPIYGDGGNVRDWLHVEDHCAGVLLALAAGPAWREVQHRRRQRAHEPQVVDTICAALEALRPAAHESGAAKVAAYRALKTFVPDRPGHDRRYAIDATKIRARTRLAPRTISRRAARDGAVVCRTIANGAARCRPGGTIASASGFSR